MKGDDGTWVLTKRKYYIYTWGFCGGTKRQYLTQKIIFHYLRSKLDLASLIYFTKDWDKFQYIPHLTFPLPLYAQMMIQSQETYGF